MKILPYIILIGAVIMMADRVAAVEPDEMLADPALEGRARVISSQLRCLVCRNESIDESDADLARDLRLLVRERLQSGDSDEGVIAYIRQRYGDYVLLDPPFKGATLLLWGGPALLFMAGIWLGWRRLRRPLVAGAALKEAEQRRVTALLKTPPKEKSDTHPNDSEAG